MMENEKPPRLMWREAKKKKENFAHISVTLAGSEDTATCRLCGNISPLEIPGRTRQGLLLEAARKHYYRHKLDLVKI